MSTAVKSCVLAVLLFASCAKGDSLVVVMVDASPSIANIALLHTKSRVSEQSIIKDVGADKAPFALGLGMKKTFGVEVPPSFSGMFSIHVEARDARGAALAQGDGTTTLSPGNQRDISITLGPIVVAVEPVWIGSGGAAATALHQLTVNVGGTDTAGSAVAPSGVMFTSGLFSSQTD